MKRRFKLYSVQNSDPDKEHGFEQTFIHTTVTALTATLLHKEYCSSMQIYSLYSEILGREFFFGFLYCCTSGSELRAVRVSFHLLPQELPLFASGDGKSSSSLTINLL
jgi:hypothetical protein